jgi:hypothetical protein
LVLDEKLWGDSFATFVDKFSTSSQLRYARTPQ